MKKLIVLFSGGMDSFAGYLHAKESYPNHNIQAMYIDYCGTGCNKEIEIAKKLIPEVKIVQNVFNFTGTEIGGHSFLYARNLYFVTYASQFADIIYLCGLKNSDMLDNTYDFYKKASVICSQVKGKDVEVTSPFYEDEKEEVVDWLVMTYGAKQAVEWLEITTSCYHPTEQFCFRCHNCAFFLFAVWKWRNAFNKKLTFHDKEVLKYHYDNAKLGKLPPKRTKSVISCYETIYGAE
ncbi:MAG: 7-cyano-7-deazaguanine synthase [Candidatus Heimdallarchaeaceae archaeon]